MVNCSENRRCKQLRFYKSSAGNHFKSILSPVLVSEQLERLKIEYRERVFSPFVTLWTYFTQVLEPDKSCRNALMSLAAIRGARGEPGCSTGTSSYCKARKRLPVEFYGGIAKRIGAHVALSSEWLWKGDIPVKVVDGTSVSMLDTKVNRLAFPRLNTGQASVGFPLARVLGLFCLSTGALIDMAIAPCKGKGTGELSLLQQFWSHFNKGDTLLGDACFSSYFLLAIAMSLGIDVVSQSSKARKFDKSKRKRLGRNDFLYVLTKPDTRRRPPWICEELFFGIPDTILIRVCEITIQTKGFRTVKKSLITTHLSSAISCADIANLYKRRWLVEINFRDIKDTLGMGIIQCQSPDMVRKQLWMYAIVYNTIRAYIASVGALKSVLPEKISFKASVQLLSKVRITNSLGVKIPADTISVCLTRHLVGNRPDRYEPRAVKRRPKPYPLLTESRKTARRKKWTRYKSKKLVA